ncbi:MAG: DUF3293 domain-containing protein [Betaproteobacteria bacterium]|nr:DUF3293 domain-containing protein [Betaproteobacteria bacterium]
MSSAIDPDLLSIYQNSDYRVLGEGSAAFVMHIGQPCKPLRNLLQRTGVSSSCFVSAYNPRSEPHTDGENARAQACLTQDVQQMGLQYLEGVGEDPGGECAGEPCLLVLGISREKAIMLGNKYGQNAMLWSEADGMPQLLLLR